MKRPLRSGSDGRRDLKVGVGAACGMANRFRGLQEPLHARLGSHHRARASPRMEREKCDEGRKSARAASAPARAARANVCTKTRMQLPDQQRNPRALRSGNECRGTARRQGRTNQRSNGRLDSGKQRMGQRLLRHHCSLCLRSGGRKVQAQRTVQSMVSGRGSVSSFIANHHQLHSAASGTDQLQLLRVNDGRCNGGTNGQHEPRQDEAAQQ